jgi:predicted RNA-binding protein
LISIIDKKFLIDVLKIPEKNIEKKDRIKFEIDLLGEKKKINFKIKDLENNKIILGKNALK